MLNGRGDHTEAVDIEFDPQQTTYAALLDAFWRWHNPTSQHNRQYMSAIFYHSEAQKEAAQRTLQEQQQSLARPIVTVIADAGPFYEAENYHQKYLLRQHPDVLDKLQLTDKQLIASTVAARLNGYIAGYGTMDQFEKECNSFNLPASSLSYVRKQVEKKHAQL